MDTHVLIWLRQGNSQLGMQSRNAIDSAFHSNELAVSSITYWEIAMLQQKQRIDLQADLSAWRKSLTEDGLIEIPVNGAIGIKAVELADFHADPADRMIVASCLLNGSSLLTADESILKWSGNLHRLDARK